MQNIKYSAVVSTCLARDESLILRSLNSIVFQKHPPSEIIVVVNGCSFPSYVDFQASCSNFFSHSVLTILRFVFNDLGNISVARNIGVKTATTNLIFFADDDDIWHPLKASLTIKRYQVTCDKHNFCLVHGYNILDCKNYLKGILKPVPPSRTSLIFLVSKIFLRSAVVNPYRRYPVSSSFFLLMLGNSLGGGSSIVASKSLCMTFPFHESLSFDEDRQFFLNLCVSGIPVQLLNYPLVTYMRHDSNATSQVIRIAFNHLQANIRIVFVLFKFLALGLVSTIFVFSVFFFKLIQQLPLKYILSRSSRIR